MFSEECVLTKPVLLAVKPSLLAHGQVEVGLHAADTKRARRTGRAELEHRELLVKCIRRRRVLGQGCETLGINGINFGCWRFFFRAKNPTFTADLPVLTDDERVTVPVHELFHGVDGEERLPVDELDGLLSPWVERFPAVLDVAVLLDAQIPALVRILFAAKSPPKQKKMK